MIIQNRGFGVFVINVDGEPFRFVPNATIEVSDELGRDLTTNYGTVIKEVKIESVGKVTSAPKEEKPEEEEPKEVQSKKPAKKK
jgi:hypothetical protein